MTEQFIQQHYDMRLVDTAISWPAVGAADFGLVGGVLDGVLMGLIVWLLVTMALRARGSFPFLSITITANVVFHVVQTEQDPTYLWALLPNVVALYVLLHIFRSLRPKRTPLRNWMRGPQSVKWDSPPARRREFRDDGAESGQARF
jgi:hypothetical protein